MTGAAAEPRVVAVIVAYNRAELLEQCLNAIARQSRAVDAVVIVDNASTDPTASVVRRTMPSAELLTLARNTGGAGGFAIGIARAVVTHDADLVWIMDDDTVPTPTALHRLLVDARQRNDVDVFASRVVWVDGSDHPMNTPRPHPFRRGRRGRSGPFAIRTASFVSLLVRATAVRAHGLPIADYFIWNDDFEYTARLIGKGDGWYSKESVVLHKTRRAGSTDDDPGERFYYEVRNKIWLARLSGAFAPHERAVYAASTMLRWLKTVARSHDRATLIRTFRRGAMDALRSTPKANSVSLADLEAAVEDVRVIEPRS